MTEAIIHQITTESIKLQPSTKKDVLNIEDVSLTVINRFCILEEQALHLQLHLNCFIVQTLVSGIFLIFLIVLFYFIFLFQINIFSFNFKFFFLSIFSFCYFFFAL